MKKICLALVAIATFASCSDDNLAEKEGLDKAQQMTFVASVDDDASTRTTINSSNKVLWSTGDAISILGVGNTANSRFTLSSGENTTKGTFTGSCPTSSTGYYAIYPYNEANGIESGNVRIQWDGSEQVAQDCFATTNEGLSYETGFPKGTPMIAYTTSDASSKTISMQFKHICAYFKVYVNMKVQSISIKANTVSDALTAQSVVVDWNSGAPTIVSTENPSNQVTLTGKDGAALLPGCYYIPVLPGTITSGITLTLLSADVEGEEGTYSKSSSQLVTLERNNIYDLGAYEKLDWHTLKGSGTQESPYLIEDFYDLQTMGYLVNYGSESGKYQAAYYRQVNNITIAENQWIGGVGSSSYPFTGFYDGNGMKLTNPNYTNGGLFIDVSNCTIRKLTIENPNWNTSKDIALSALVQCVASSSTTLTNIHDITVTSDNTLTVNNVRHFGAVVANVYGNAAVYDCVSSLKLNLSVSTTATDIAVGGIVGSTSSFLASNAVSLQIYNCRNKGSIYYNNRCETSLPTAQRVGGILGQSYDNFTGQRNYAQIYNCVNNASVSVNAKIHQTYNYVGGIVGCMDVNNTSSSITNCINNGTVENQIEESGYNAQAGGIVGYCYTNDIKISLCANTGTLKSQFYGAIIGQNNKGTMSYCFNTYWTCKFLSYPEGGDDNGGIKTVFSCDVHATLSEIPGYMNGYLGAHTPPAGVTYATWKTYTEGDTTLDLNF